MGKEKSVDRVFELLDEMAVFYEKARDWCVENKCMDSRDRIKIDRTIEILHMLQEYKEDRSPKKLHEIAELARQNR